MSSPAGLRGLEMLRAYTEKNRRNLTALLGAFRNQSARPLYRFAGGRGTFHGPYYGIDQPSDKLTLDQFRNALLELHLELPLAETEAIFTAMADAHGRVGIVDLVREVRAEPCDRSGRWGRSGLGEPLVADGVAHPADVQPTRRSGYSGGGWRPAPRAPAYRPAPAPDKENSHRVAPTLSSAYRSGANVLSSQISLGDDARQWREPPPPPPPPPPSKAKVGPGGHGSAYAQPLLHAAGADTADRWRRDGIGVRRPPPPPPASVREARPSSSGYTHPSSLHLGGGDDAPRAAPPTQPVVWSVAPRNPWQSGYNRGERDLIGPAREAWVPEDWERRGIGRDPTAEPPPVDTIVLPTRQSPFTCSLCEVERDRGRPGQCAFCRMYP